MIFAVPYRMTTVFIILHPFSIPPYPRRLKAGDLRIPYRGL